MTEQLRRSFKRWELSFDRTRGVCITCADVPDHEWLLPNLPMAQTYWFGIVLGHSDELMESMLPPFQEAGDEGPLVSPATNGSEMILGDTLMVGERAWLAKELLHAIYEWKQ